MGLRALNATAPVLQVSAAPAFVSASVADNVPFTARSPVNVPEIV